MRSRNWLKAVLVLVVCALLAGAGSPAGAVCLDLDQEAADFTIEDIDGNLAVILPDADGSGVLVTAGIDGVDLGRLVSVDYVGLEGAFDTSSAAGFGGTVFGDTLVLTQPSADILRIEETSVLRFFLQWSDSAGLSVGSPWAELDISSVDRVMIDLGFGDDSVTIQGDIALGTVIKG